ncbi:hypothetical protein [Chryseolinea soli]|uniref:hypothetical protein n=1 Tax=Chryseolinea soli TaxID=2321403 RepID=UPI001357BEDE|nr:hypothetical protein [Chryseolinea soli]
MRNCCTTALLLLLFFGVAKAQVPGYMGRRFTIFLEANPTPAFLVSNANNAAIWDIGAKKVSRFAFNFRPQVSLEYLLGRDFSLGFSYGRIQIGTDREYEKVEDGPRFKDYDVLRGQTAGIHFKFYDFKRSSSLAPIGYYRTISLYVTQTNTYDTKKSTVKQFKNDFVYPVISFSGGRQTMLAKGLILKTGVELGYCAVPMNWFVESGNEQTVQEYAGYQVHENLFLHYLFNINVALGYTPF